jgi:hypothetical protein
VRATGTLTAARPVAHREAQEIDSEVEMSSAPARVHALLVRPVLLVVLAAAVALGALLAAAQSAAATDGVVLAVDYGQLGPDPMPRDAENNPARELSGYEDRDIPFTWGAAWLLTFLGFGGLATMGLVYWRAVDRPGRNKAPVRR